jgi:two-component system NtrC family sensor kinase
MRRVPKVHLKLRGKLTLTFLTVGLVLTAINMLSTRWLQRRWEQVVAERTETVRRAEALAAVSNGIFEEGFGYVLSGEPAEKKACLDKLQSFELLRRQLLTQADLPPEEARVLKLLGLSLQRAQVGARGMFESYEARGRVEQSAFEAYEVAMDNLTDGVHKLAEEIRLRSTADNEAARSRMDQVLLAIAIAAAVIAIGMGTSFGILLTRPLFELRDAATRVGEGDFGFISASRSRDELGDLAQAFTQMAGNIRRLLAVEAEQKSRLANIFASLGETLLVCNADGRITAVNRAACATLGYREDEIVGLSLDAILVTARFEDLLTRTERQAAQGTSDTSGEEPQLLRKDGKRVSVSLSTSLLRAANQATGLICVAQDLSDRLRLEAELRQAQKLEAIGRLASGIAHEINTPTQFVSDSVYFVRDATQDLLSLIEKYRAVQSSFSPGALALLSDAEQAADLPYLMERLPKAVDRALDGLSRITSIVRSMKIFAHPDQRQMAPVDLNLAVQSTLTVASYEYKYIAELETEFGELPPVTCHAGEINQAVLNLIVNAAHAIADQAKDGEKGVIRVETRRDGDSVIISVSDTGAGIPDSIRDRIFDPFFTTKEVGRGTGQGLSVAHSVIVEKHHGQLSFKTECGRGSTFEIRLPLS